MPGAPCPEVGIHGRSRPPAVTDGGGDRAGAAYEVAAREQRTSDPLGARIRGDQSTGSHQVPEVVGQLGW